MRRNRFKTKLAISSAALVGLMLVTAAPQFSQVFAQSTSSFAKLPGSQAVAATRGTQVGKTNASKKITLSISLNLRNADQMDGFIKSLYDPSSPNYKQFLTPTAFAQKFGPAQSTVDEVTSFLKSVGLHVVSVSPERTLIQVSGSVGQIEKAFHVTINNYRDTKGQVYFANANQPQLPTNLVGVITGISGLNNEATWHHAGAKVRNLGKLNHSKPGTGVSANGKSTGSTQPMLGNGPAGGYTPTELRSAYDVAPLSSAGYDGSGQTVALFELDGYVQSNITTYDNNYNLGSPAPQTVLVDGYNGSAGSGEGEVELDIEVINAMAPKANVKVYEGPNSTQGVIDTYQKIATDDTAKEISTSWGESELQSNTSTMNSMHSIFQQMATQGQSIFSASGDSGAYDGGGSQLAVDSPANDPEVTGVGGTALNLNSSGGYGSESAWSNSSNNSGGGGGLSTIYSQPSWQTGPGVSNSYSNGMREVPDVSADADPSTGYSIYSGGKWTVYGGTSCAAPLWAGITALNNQYAEALGKADLGFANPTLYKMFNTTQTYPAYHDVTSGNNLYYPATSGYDMATGIGTPDAYNLVRDINGSSSSGGGGGGGTTSSQLVQNSGFESGSSPWVEYSAGGYELVDTTNPHTGSYSAYLGGYNNADDSIYQTISIPSTDTSATLTFWSDVQTYESTHAYDFMYTEIRDQSGNVLKTLQTQSDGTPTGWTKNTFDLSAYVGKTIEVYFEATNDSSNPTNFFVDDVTVNAK